MDLLNDPMFDNIETNNNDIIEILINSTPLKNNNDQLIDCYSNIKSSTKVSSYESEDKENTGVVCNTLNNNLFISTPLKKILTPKVTPLTHKKSNSLLSPLAKLLLSTSKGRKSNTPIFTTPLPPTQLELNEIDVNINNLHELNDNCSICSNLTQQVAILESTVEDYKDEITCTIDEVIALQEELAELRLACIIQSDALINSQEDVSQFSSSYNSIQEEGTRLYELYSVKCTQLDEITKKLELLTSVCRETEAENEDLRNKYEECYNNYSEMHKTALNNSEAYKACSEEYESVATRLKLLEEKDTLSEQFIREWEERYQNAQNEMQSIAETYESAQKECEELKMTKDLFSKQAEDMKLELLNLKSQYSSVSTPSSLEFLSDNNERIVQDEKIQELEENNSELREKVNVLFLKEQELLSQIEIIKHDKELLDAKLNLVDTCKSDFVPNQELPIEVSNYIESLNITNILLRTENNNLQTMKQEAIAWQNKAKASEGYVLLNDRLKKDINDLTEQIELIKLSHHKEIESLHMDHDELLRNLKCETDCQNNKINGLLEEIESNNTAIKAKDLEIEAYLKKEEVSIQRIATVENSLKNSQNDLRTIFRTYQSELEALKTELADDSYRRKYAVSMDLFSRYQETFLNMDNSNEEFNLTSQLVIECQKLIEKMKKSSELFKQEESVLLSKLEFQTTYTTKVEAEMSYLRSVMLEFDNKILAKDEIIAQAEVSLSESKAQTLSLQEKLQKADLQLQSMNDDLNSAQEEISSLTSIKFDLEHSIDVNDESLRILKADYDLLNENYKSLEMERNALKETVASLEGSVEDAGQREINCQEEILSLNDQVKSFKEDLEKMKLELSVKSLQYEELFKNNDLTLSQLNSTIFERDEAQALLEDERIVGADIQNEMKEEIERYQRIAASTNKELSHIQEEVTILSEKLSSAKSNIQDLQNGEIANKEKFEIELSTLSSNFQKEINQLNEERIAEQNEFKDIGEEANAQISRMENSIYQLTSKLEDMVSQNMHLDDEKLFISNELLASKDENLMLKNFNLKLESEVNKKSEEILALRFEFDSSHNSTNESLVYLNTQLDESRQEFRDLTVQMQKSTQESNELKELYNVLNDSLKSLHEEHDELMTKYSDLCESKKLSAQSFEATISNLQVEVYNLSELNRNNKSSIESLENQLSSSEVSRKKLMNDMQTLHVTKTQTQEAQIYLDRASKNISDLTLKVNTQADEINSLKFALENERAIKANGNLLELESKINSLKAENEALANGHNEVAELKKNVQIFQAKYMEKKEKEKDLQSMRQKAYKWVIETVQSASGQSNANSSTIQINISELSKLCVGILQAPSFLPESKDSESAPVNNENVSNNAAPKTAFRRVSLMPGGGSSRLSMSSSTK